MPKTVRARLRRCGRGGARPTLDRGSASRQILSRANLEANRQTPLARRAPPAKRTRPRRNLCRIERLDGVADVRPLPKLFELHAQPVPQRTFGPQLVDQRFGLRKEILRKFGPTKKLPPRSRYFQFGQQFRILYRQTKMNSHTILILEAGAQDAIGTRRTGNDSRATSRLAWRWPRQPPDGILTLLARVGRVASPARFRLARRRFGAYCSS